VIESIENFHHFTLKFTLIAIGHHRLWSPGLKSSAGLLIENSLVNDLLFKRKANS